MKQNRKRLPLPVFLLLQLLLAGLVLCVFALFHHVIPYSRTRTQGMPAPIAAVERSVTPSPAPLPTDSAQAEVQPEETIPEEAEEPEPTEEPRPLTWAEKFAEHFTEETVWEDMHYSSPAMAVTITKYEYTELLPKSVYFVADIYLSDVEQLQAAFPLNGYSFAVPAAIARDAGAIIAVNGDCFVDQRDGFVVRNGQIYDQNPTTADVCALYYDGRMETYGPGEYTAEEIIDGEPWQLWHFGPSLLNADGSPKEDFNISEALLVAHPRTALGYYEPGHYCFVVVDGRQGGYSLGADMKTLSKIMSGLGCAAAYNLDGGASSVMVFNGKLVNHPIGDRYLNDLVIAAEIREAEE